MLSSFCRPCNFDCICDEVNFEDFEWNKEHEESADYDKSNNEDDEEEEYQPASRQTIIKIADNIENNRKDPEIMDPYEVIRAAMKECCSKECLRELSPHRESGNFEGGVQLITKLRSEFAHMNPTERCLIIKVFSHQNIHKFG